MCVICENVDLSQITELTACLNAKKLPLYIPNLLMLNINNNKHIKKIPNSYPVLQELYCNNTKIKKIPYFIFLIILECNNTKIKEIPQFNSLKILKINNTKIKLIPNLYNLLLLSCNNTKIKEIYHLTNLKEIYCSGCKYLIDQKINYL